MIFQLGGGATAGTANLVETTVVNKDTVPIVKGDVVYISGAQGDVLAVKLASNTTDAMSSKTFGVASSNIAVNGTGTVVEQGEVSGLNLGAYTTGDILWLGATPGSYTTTKPVAPAHLVFVGVVLRANGGNGILFVRTQNGYELEEIHNVLLTATYEWPGPHTLTYAAGAPTAGTGTVGSYYLDTTVPNAAVLYGPKQSNNSWPLIGTQNVAWGGGTVDPIGVATITGTYYVKVSNLGVPLSAWGPYTSTGLGERSVLSFDNTTKLWKDSKNEVVTAIDGGNWAAQTAATVTGTYVINPNLASYFNLTLTGVTNFSTFGISRPRIDSSTRASRITVALKQGGSGSYTVTWPASVKWKANTPPVLSTTVGAVDVIDLITFDNGTTWLGCVIEQDIRA
jgi:hypothetical protein